MEKTRNIRNLRNINSNISDIPDISAFTETKKPFLAWQCLIIEQ